MNKQEFVNYLINFDRGDLANYVISRIPMEGVITDQEINNFFVEADPSEYESILLDLEA